MDVIKFGLSHWKKEFVVALFIQLVGFAAILMDLMIPLISEIFVDYIILEQAPEDIGIFTFLISGKYGEIHSMQLFFSVAIVFIVLTLTRIALIYIKNTTRQRIGLRLETKLRKLTFHKLMELDSETLANYNSGELLMILNGDTIMFKEMFCRVIPNVFDSIFMLITCVVLLTGINGFLLVIPVILSPILILTLRGYLKQSRKNFTSIRTGNSRMNLAVQENIEAVRLVRSFTNETYEKEKFNKINKEVKENYIRQIHLTSKYEVIFSSIKQVAYIGAIAICAIFVIRGELLVGFLVASANYVMKIMDHITQINQHMFQMQQQFVAGRNMRDFLEAKTQTPEVDSPKVVDDKKPDIKLSHVTLEVDGQRILSDINLDIPFGKKVGIVGETGSGKSVLLKTLVRTRDVTSGSVQIDGVDIKEYSLSSLRDMYSYVFQDVFLFSNTIDSNIAYAIPEIDQSEVEEAARHAQAHDFIMGLPNQYSTIIGERGLGISGGQKQRVSIARALLKNAPVLVMDDSTSALDVNTEKQLLSDIKEFYPDKTILISAHRLSSVVDCDEIIYMQDGAIVERGTFKEMMELNGHFAHVYRIQENERQSVVDYDHLDGSSVQ